MKKTVVIILLAVLYSHLSKANLFEGDFKKIPFSRAGNLILLSSKIDSLQGFFIFDTGSSKLVLNTAYCDNGITSGDQVVSLGSQTERIVARAGNLQIAGMSLAGLEADCSDLSSIEDQKQLRIFGLLGLNYLNDYAILIDYPLGQLILMKTDRKGRILAPSALSSYGMSSRHKISVKQDVAYAKIAVNGKKLWAVIDTGAEACLLDRDADRLLIDALRIRGRYLIDDANGQKVEVLLASVPAVFIGEAEFINLRMVVTNLKELNKAYDRQVDFVVGYTCLSQKVVCINLRKKEMVFYRKKE